MARSTMGKYNNVIFYINDIFYYIRKSFPYKNDFLSITKRGSLSIVEL